MKFNDLITMLGVSILLFYSIINILQFYGIGENVYGIYVMFYIFIVISILVLPSDYPKLL